MMNLFKLFNWFTKKNGDTNADTNKEEVHPRYKLVKKTETYADGNSVTKYTILDTFDDNAALVLNIIDRPGYQTISNFCRRMTTTGLSDNAFGNPMHEIEDGFTPQELISEINKHGLSDEYVSIGWSDFSGFRWYSNFVHGYYDKKMYGTCFSKSYDAVKEFSINEKKRIEDSETVVDSKEEEFY